MARKYSKTKGALFLGAPFLFITAAVILFSIGGFTVFVESNAYYRVLTNSPEEISGTDEDSYLNIDDYTEEQLQALQENSEGMHIKSSFPVIALGQQWATISIESADVDAVPVYHGTSDFLLMKGIGHSFNSRFPGQNGRIVLAGHVGISDFFQNLETMSVGDRVNLNTIYGDYVYEVVETVIFDDTDSSWLRPLIEEDGDQLVCYTCYPYHTTSVRTRRFAIICEKVSGDDWTQEVE